MKKYSVLPLLVVFMFVIPLPGPTTNMVPSDETSTGWDLPRDFSVADYSVGQSGTGQSLPVFLTGTLVNRYDSVFEISSTSPGTTTISLDTGWTGSRLVTRVRGMSTWRTDDLLNGQLDSYHSEKFIVSGYSQSSTSVSVPNSWTLGKQASFGSALNRFHPAYGIWRFSSSSGAGYGGTMGWRFQASWSASDYLASTDRIYMGQLVNVPYRELYGTTISLQYRIPTSPVSNMNDQVYLFVSFAGYEAKLRIFEPSDPVGSWIAETVTIPSAYLSSISMPNALLLQVGLGTDLSGTQSTAQNAYVFVDNIELRLNVRPFPEQLGLKANGTSVVGSEWGSTYQYLTGSGRDCYDDPYYGLDLDGVDWWSSSGINTVSLYSDGGSNDWANAQIYRSGLQFPLQIPRGAVILRAYLELYPTESVDPPAMRIYVAGKTSSGQSVSPFTTGTPHLKDRFMWSSTGVDWTPLRWNTEGDESYGYQIIQRSPDLAPLVQSVVSDGGWTSGQYICIMLDYMNSATTQSYNNFAGSYGLSPPVVPRLMVEYLVPLPDDEVYVRQYRKDLVIDHNKVAADLTYFPVMVDITDADLRTKAQADGDDIAFSMGNIGLDHEIEYYDSSTGRLVAWVLVPYLSSTVDTVISMQYGNPYARRSVCRSMWRDYALVMHMSDDPSGVLYDSSPYRHYGTSYGSMSGGSLVPGKADGAIRFDGVDDRISVGQINTDSWSKVTFSAWVYHDDTGDDRVFSKAFSTSPSYHIMATQLAGTTYRVRLWTDGTNGQSATHDFGTVTSGQWHYISWTWDSSTGLITAYLNGNQLGSAQSHTGATVRDSVEMFIIGDNSLATDPSHQRFLAGRVDEIRLRPQSLSAAWFWTEYQNQNSPSTFMSVGSERVNPLSWVNESVVKMTFSTSSQEPVAMDVQMLMSIEGEGRSLDENFEEGTSFYVANASIVEWTAKILVSPPPETNNLEVRVAFPQQEWRPTKVTNPLGAVKTLGTQWYYEGGEVVVPDGQVDVFGVWTINFVSMNYILTLDVGPPGGPYGTTANFSLGQTMRFRMTVPWITGARQGLILTDPTGTVQWESYTTSTGSPAHLYPSFRYRKTITISSSKVYADLTNFPVLIDILDSDLRNPSKVQPDGDDILFVQNGKVLAHELELFVQDYDATHARLVAWVRANLSATADTVLTMYYGNPILGPQSNPKAVWSNAYDAVWHLGEIAIDEQTTATHVDSTGHGYYGNQYGNANTTLSNGKILRGQIFDGVNDLISVSASLGLAPSGNVALSGWFYLPTTFSSSSPTSYLLMSKYQSVDYNMHLMLVGNDYLQGSVAKGSLVFKMETQPAGARYMYTTRSSWAAGWYHYTILLNSTDMSRNAIYINGLQESTLTVLSATTGSLSFSGTWGIGGGYVDYGQISGGASFLNGRMDEVRVSSTIRSAGWIRTEYESQSNPSAFYTVGSEQTREDLAPYIDKTVTSSYPAGVWTVSAYYNDTGTGVDTRTGLYERKFIIKRATSLSLIAPGDAVGDGVSTRVVGQGLYIEVRLRDSGNLASIPGATVRMNWTVSGSPSIRTMNDYGDGRYGIALNTTDLSLNTRWRINIWSRHDYYQDTSMYFFLDLSHNTQLTYAWVSTTPVGFDFRASLYFRDAYTGAPVTGATIKFSNGTPVSVVAQGGGWYNISIPTTGMSPGDYSFTFVASKSGAYLESASVDVTFTLRRHYTALSVSGDLVTPQGFTTAVTVSVIDLDTGTPVPLGSTSSLLFTWSGGSHNVQPVTTYQITLPTGSWNIGTVDVVLTAVLSSTYYNPDGYTFQIQIRKHYTAVTAIGSFVYPYGNMTPVTLKIVDLDTGTTLAASTVSSISFTWSGGSYSPSPPYSSLSFVLDSSSWAVGSKIVTVSVVMGSIYFSPDNHQFTVTIVSMRTVLYHEPSDLLFPRFDDFVIVLRVNVSEPGPYYGSPITGLSQTHFSLSAYAIKSLTNLGDGRYRLTIDQSYFTQGTYIVTVTVNPTDSRYASALLQIVFQYRPAESLLSSPNYPLVITPVLRDVVITLNYTDLDRSTGITTAVITAQGVSIYDQQNLGNGLYRVTVNVQSLSVGEYVFNLTATASGYVSKTLTFNLRVRVAYTYAIPTVGALDIPVGNDPVFYVDYYDTDNSVPISGASVASTWSKISVTYLPAQGRYQVTFITDDTDPLVSNMAVEFEFTKGSNYQPGVFSISVTIRTHRTEFRLVSAIEPTPYNSDIQIPVYYGDIDNNVGINEMYVYCYVRNATHLVTSQLTTGGQAGFFIVKVPAAQFGGPKLVALTVYFNWTGPSVKYYNMSISVTANVVGEDSRYTLLLASEPTPYGYNMSYVFLYSDLSGSGITNSTGGVHIYVKFDRTVNLNLVTIREVNRVGQPGVYSISFNNEILGGVGLVYMQVYINWTGGAPFYTNRQDTVSVRVQPRDTLLSVMPPVPTPRGENASFVFTLDDITGAGSVPVEYDPAHMFITLSISSYSLTYNSQTREFTVSFNTAQSPIGDAPLGQKSFNISVIWTGAPFYANHTGRIMYVSVTARLTVLDYQSPSPTPFGDVCTFFVVWTDVTSSPVGVDGATVALYDGGSLIPGSYYTVTGMGGGSYKIELDTDYYSSPGSKTLRVSLSATVFYILDVSATRNLLVQQRLSLVSSEPPARVPYGLPIHIVVYYQDRFTLSNIGNSTGKVRFSILNGSSWYYTIEWKESFGYYVLTVETSNHPELLIDVPYYLHVMMSYADEAPFYASDDAYIEFRLRLRVTALELVTAPTPTPYQDYVSFIVLYRDIDTGDGVDGATISLKKGAVTLVYGTHYTLVAGPSGTWTVIVSTTALDGLGKTTVTVAASRAGVPYRANATLNVSLDVTRRPTTIDVISATPSARYNDNIVIVFAYVDTGTSTYVGGITDKVMLFRYSTLIPSGQYSLVAGSVPNTLVLTVSTSVLSSVLVNGLPLTIKVYWLDVIPYYNNASLTLPVNIINRAGMLSHDPVESTPLGDQMQIRFYYVDADTGVSIADAIVLLDCVQKPGLQQGTDYTITYLSGVYTILVDTNRLNGIGSYTFLLTIQWNPSTPPFYSNQTTRSIPGSVRLVAANLEVGLPSPISVPFYANVTFDMTFTDQDHMTPILGLTAGSVSIKYKHSNQPPLLWSFRSLGGGVYRITVNVTTEVTIGVRTLAITVNMYPYVELERQVSFQVRNRLCAISLVSMPESIYAGDPVRLFLNVTDEDAGGSLVSGASFVLVWDNPPGPPIEVSYGIYQVDLVTIGMSYGLRQLTISASKTGYETAYVAITINLLPITTDLVISGDLVGPYYWGDTLTVYAYFNDTVHGTGIEGIADVSFTWGGLPYVSLTELGSGNFSAFLDTSLVSATTVTVIIQARAPNYLTASASFLLSILPRPVSLSSVGSPTMTVPRGSKAQLTVYLTDLKTGNPLTTATIVASWNFEGVPGTAQFVSRGGGYYDALVDTGTTKADQVYQILVTSTLANYQTASTSFQIYTTQTRTFVILDSQTKTYEERAFAWSEVIRIGVYVLALDLNQTDPDYIQWNSTVRLEYETLQFYMMRNGTTGHFYFDFNTTLFDTGTYAFRIIATPANRSFAQSSNRTVITVFKVQTSVIPPSADSPYWGVSKWYNFTYFDVVRNQPIANDSYNLPVIARYRWAGHEGLATYFGNGVYGVFVNTSLLTAGQLYILTISFEKRNFESREGRVEITVRRVPTEIVVISPFQNQVDGNPRVLQVPIGDVIDILFLFNDTDNSEGYVGGLNGATLNMATRLSGPNIDVPLTMEDIVLEPLGNGLYRFVFDTRTKLFGLVSKEPFRLTIGLSLPNREDAVVLVLVTVIKIPTELVVTQPIPSWTVMNGETQRIVFYYNDTWHNRGIAGATFNATSSSSSVFVVNYGELGGGYYYVDVVTGGIRLAESSAFVIVTVTLEDYADRSMTLVVTVTQNPTDTMFTTGLQYGLPIALIGLLLTVGYVKIWSVPKRLRQINKLIRQLKKNKIPKPITDVRSRSQILADLFADTFSELSLTRTAEQMPAESVPVDIPELGELLMQLSILTRLGPQELDDFKADISKMKLSEQATFMKEVINQEAIRAARREGKSVEQVLEEVRSEARKRLGERVERERIEEIEEEGIIIPQKPTEPTIPTRPGVRAPPTTPATGVEHVTAGPTEKLSQFELEELKKELEAKGVPLHEIDTIIEQAKNLPRELVDELLRSIGKR